MSAGTYRAALAFAERRAVFDLHRAENDLHFVGPIHPRASFLSGECAARAEVLDMLQQATAAASRQVLS